MTKQLQDGVRLDVSYSHVAFKPAALAVHVE
jgi:hypothetical protein